MVNINAEEIAKLTSGIIIGDNNKTINGLNSIKDAGCDDLTFLSDKKYLKYLKNCNAGIILINKDFEYEINHSSTYVAVDDAYKAIVVVYNFIDAKINKPESGIHRTAVIEESTVIGKNVLVSSGSYVGRNCKIGDNVMIMPNTTVYDNSEIGDNTLVHSNVVIAKDSKIGKRCLIQAGAVIGSEGFGFLEDKSGSFAKIPQLGNVVIGDDVEIGANTTIDRAMIGSTVIGNGVKLDNLIQVGHNCKIGENTAAAAQVGISGSVTIGKRCRLGGQVGIAGHLTITDDVILMAQSGVAKSVENPGMYFGSPIKDRLQAFKIEAAIRHLPDIVKDISKIKNELSNIKSDN
jgi:UDP-3-O-[3-hydroxymyristoyl] glucosamine N-acyltransferase